MENNKKLKTGPIVMEMPAEFSGGQTVGQYSRDSFERFGDDLCELLLSYLTFKDKITLEYVCKQWQRNVFNKQRVLRVFSVHPIEAIPHLTNHYLNDLMVPIVVKNYVSGYANNLNMRTIDIKRLESLLNKCCNIRKIDFTRIYIDSPLLELIGHMCPNLESIKFDLIGLEEEDIIRFGEKCGQNLKQIRFNNTRSFTPRDYSNRFCAEFGKKLLFYCINIKSFQCEDITLISDKRIEFLPKLESIDLKLRRSDAQNFIKFVDKYDSKLKKLKLFSSEVEFNTLRNTMQQISRFKNIEDLDISFNLMLHNTGNYNTINDKLTEIAKNCPKIKRFLININIFMTGSEFIAGNIWECLGKFSNLRQLEVTMKLSANDETIETLKRLKHLQHLSIKSSKLGDPFFKDVDMFLPNLRSLQLNTDYELTDNLMLSLSRLKQLRKITLGSGHKALRLITDAGVSMLIDNCPHMRKMVFLARPNITRQTVDKLIEFANKNTKSNITFYSGFSRVGDESLFAPIDMSSYTNMPANLRVMIRTVGPNFNPPNLPPHMGNLPHLANELAHNIHVIELNLENHNIFPPPLNMQPDIQVVFHNHPIQAQPNPFLLPPPPNFLL